MAAQSKVQVLQPAETYALRLRILRGTEPGADHPLDGDDHPLAFHVGVKDAGEVLSIGSILVNPQPKQPGESPYQGGPDAWRIRGMAVSESLRGSGVGGQMLQALLAHADSKQPTWPV